MLNDFERDMEDMKKHSDTPALIFLLLRLFICLWLGRTALNVWGIGGRIVDWYTDETVLSLPTSEFASSSSAWETTGLLIAMLAAIIAAIATVPNLKFFLIIKSSLSIFVF